MRDLAELTRAIEDDPALVCLREEARRRLGDDPGHDLSHCLRVALWTLRLVEEEVDARRAIAAALLHDVVNLPKDSPDRARASERSSAVASDLLPALGFDAEAVEDVVLAIRDHSYSRGARPTRPLGRALQDADRLEALGALGLLRTASCGARMGARYFPDTDPWAYDRELDDRAYTLDHFFRKLLRLPETLHTEAGRREARRRAQFLVAFLRQLGEEIGEPPPPGRLELGEVDT